MKKQELLEHLLNAQKEGKLADKSIVAKVECADERVVEQWNKKLKKSDDEDPFAAYQKAEGKHIKSATHMKDHKLVQHTSHTLEDHHDMRDFMEHVTNAAEKGHKVHVTYHPATDEYHVSSWKPQAKK